MFFLSLSGSITWMFRRINLLLIPVLRLSLLREFQMTTVWKNVFTKPQLLYLWIFRKLQWLAMVSVTPKCDDFIWKLKGSQITRLADTRIKAALHGSGRFTGWVSPGTINTVDGLLPTEGPSNEQYVEQGCRGRRVRHTAWRIKGEQNGFFWKFLGPIETATHNLLLHLCLSLEFWKSRPSARIWVREVYWERRYDLQKQGEGRKENR